MPAWLGFSLLAMLFWGLWAFLPKLSARTLDPSSTLFFQQVGAMVMGIAVLAGARFKLKVEPAGIAWAAVTGILGVAGLLCYFQGLWRYRIGVVVMLTSLYPVLTILLSVVVLREKVTLMQGLGIILALVAIALMSTPSE